MSLSTHIADTTAGPVEYRLERRGPQTVVVFHGGHMHAGVALGEDPFLERGYSVLVPSRPGYGRTPLSIGDTPTAFADVVPHLLRHLEIGAVDAALGISAGGPFAISMAARHPDIVGRLVLQSSISSLPWPETATRIAARIAFNPVTERATWAITRLLLRGAPRRGLTMLMRSLSTESGRHVLDRLGDSEHRDLLQLFGSMQSSRGFMSDLEMRLDPDVARAVSQPTLVMASRRDGSVPFEHAEELVRLIPDARLVTSEAPSHLLWFGGPAGDPDDAIRAFLP